MKDMKQETGTEKKEDRRVRRTKKLLSQGLIELMQQKQVKDITVRELADLVDVNRGTFYLYYRDIFDMLERLEEELFEQLNAVILAHKGEPILTHARPMLRTRRSLNIVMLLAHWALLVCLEHGCIGIVWNQPTTWQRLRIR